jgi:5-oxoprolinase (ATP-hydrolysing)
LVSRLQVLMEGLEGEEREEGKEFETQRFAEESAERSWREIVSSAKLREVRRVGIGEKTKVVVRKVRLKYEGTNSILGVDFDLDWQKMRDDFEVEHKLRYGFIQLEKAVVVESVSVEVIQQMDTPEEPLINCSRSLSEVPKPVEIVRMFTADQWHDTPVYRREDLEPGDIIRGSAIIVEKISTIVVEPNWEARLTELNHLVLQRQN